MSLRVRQIERREWRLAQTAAACLRNGQDATLEYPTRQGMWVRVSDAEKDGRPGLNPVTGLNMFLLLWRGRRFLPALSIWLFPGLRRQSGHLNYPYRICPAGVYMWRIRCREAHCQKGNCCML